MGDGRGEWVVGIGWGINRSGAFVSQDDGCQTAVETAFDPKPRVLSNEKRVEIGWFAVEIE